MFSKDHKRSQKGWDGKDVKVTQYQSPATGSAVSHLTRLLMAASKLVLKDYFFLFKSTCGLFFFFNSFILHRTYTCVVYPRKDMWFSLSIYVY